MTNRTRTDVLLLAGFCIFLFFYGLGQFGLIGADEPRYAQVAREMIDRHDWVTPTLGGSAWLEKPPLYYWQAMIAYSVIGVSDTAARIPSALDATLLIIAVFLFFRRFRHGVGVDAALITASSAGIIAYARAASMDMPLTASFAIGMLGWWAWRESGKKIYLAAFYGFMALGMLAKGPVAPFLAGLIILVSAAAFRDWRLIGRTLWLPGILLFLAIALPWYIAVQVANPQFFREFILQHNLERFSSNLYHHPEPFWYYIPVTTLALVPWIVFVCVAFIDSLRSWWNERKPARSGPDPELEFRVFICCWLLVPVVFFSISQSKLPGYILPAVPAGAILLADYLLRHLEVNTSIPKGMAVVHAFIAAVPMVPAVLVGNIVAQHHMPTGRPLLFACAISTILFVAIALTLFRTNLRMLRFVTLIPVVLAVAAILKMGTAAINERLSTRPLEEVLERVETHKLPIAVCGVSREVEYGLAFYRNQVVERYETRAAPAEEHLLIASPTWKSNVMDWTKGRHVTLLGHYTSQDLDYYWVAGIAKP